MTQWKQQKIINDDITLEARWQWRGAAKVISSLIIFAVFYSSKTLMKEFLANEWFKETGNGTQELTWAKQSPDWTVPNSC